MHLAGSRLIAAVTNTESSPDRPPTDRATTDPNRVHLLAKPSAVGKRGRALTETIDAAKALGFKTTVLTAPTTDAIPETIRDAGEIGRLVIVGGDGLINHSLAALVDTGITVGIVPSGTGNDFARALGIGRSRSTRSNSVHRQAILGAAAPIDVIAADDGRYAASVLTAGFSGRVTARANPMRFPPGQSKYTVATLLEAARLEPVAVRLRTPDHELDMHTSFFAVANTRYFGGGMAICPDADPTDGLLDLAVIAAVSPAALLRVMPLVFAGRHVRHPDVTTLRARWIEIETDEPLWADGEPFGAAPVRLQAKPGALLIARPAS